MPEVSLKNDQELLVWIDQQMQDGREWLLAHCDDGVIWGKHDAEGKLVTSHQFAPKLSPKLRLATLQQAFVFGENDQDQSWRGEARLWRGEMSWETQLVKENPTTDWIDEDQLLWGTKVYQGYEQPNFTHVREEEQQLGLEHVVPIKVSEQELQERRLKLRVRHFIQCDAETGEARIFLSRLVKVFISPEG